MISMKRLLLVGDDGSGKSSTGNSLIGLPFFQGLANTCETLMGKSRVDNNLLWIVITRGLFSQGLTPRDRAINIQRYLQDLSFQPHAVLLIFNPNDGAANQQQMINMLKLAFGDQIFRYCIVVLTHSNAVVPNEEHFQMIVDICNGRSTTIQNSASNVPFNIPVEDVQHLMAMVSELGGIIYNLPNERRQALEEVVNNEDLEMVHELLERRLRRRQWKKELIRGGKYIVALSIFCGVFFCCSRKIEIVKQERIWIFRFN